MVSLLLRLVALVAFTGSIRAAAAIPDEWTQGSGGRYRLLTLPKTGRPGFVSLPPEVTGITFTNRLDTDRSLTNHILLNGSGVALGDVDGDGWCDVFLSGLGGGSALFRNRGGWNFEEVTATALASDPGAEGRLDSLDASGAVLADLDGDGMPELLVNVVGGGTRCWRNDGRGRFRDVTSTSGMGSASGASSLALADIDGDGDLDVYVVNYRSSTVRDEFQQKFQIRRVEGRPVVVGVNGRPATDPDLVGRFTVGEDGQVTEHGEADGLFRNEGGCRFVRVSFTDGTFLNERGVPLSEPPFDWGLAAMFRDLNGDGAPDLYVCNDLGSPDRLWMNDGRGRFRAIARTAIRKTSWFSMGVDFGDLNRDGHDDFMVTDMLSRDPVRRQLDASRMQADVEPFLGIEARPQSPRNTLFAGRGDGTFAEVAWWAGIAASDWSWSPVFLDVDLDGFEDVLITTGFERDVQDGDVAEEIEVLRQRDRLSDAASLQLRRRFPSLKLPNLAFRNRGDLTFAEVGTSWGFDQSGISHGMALADLDRDGDLDAVINNQNSVALILRNESIEPRIKVRLRGAGANTSGVGARIEVIGGSVPQSQEMIAGGRYLSGDEPARVFAAGHSTNRLTLRVRWRSGRESQWEGIGANQEVELVEPSSPAPSRERPPTPPPLFVDVSQRLQHRHFEEPFDDFSRQPLLPRSMASLGPAVAWGDLNRDGADDLIVGTGRGGRMGVFLNDGTGGFAMAKGPLWEQPAVLDQSGILIWPRGTNAPDVVVGFSRYESGGSGGGIRVMDPAAGVMRLGGGVLPAAIGPLAAADVDGDGTLDLFVGGRVMPGRYPEPAPSALFFWREGRFVPDPVNAGALAGLGMSTAATFSDLDGDGDPDLVVACEWGSLRFFGNDRGRLVERDFPLRWEDPAGRPTRLREMTGWWNGVTPVDLDEDGRLDLVVANWGRNTQYGGGPGWQTSLHFGDFDTNGTVELIESGRGGAPPGSPETLMRTRASLIEAWAALADRFPTRRSVGEASVAALLGNQVGKAGKVSVNTLESVVLLNRGDHFEVRPLPAQAQWAPAFGVVAADFDGDGHEDIFLSQNFFATGLETDRDDAGQGLLLRGDGRGGLVAVDALESGLRLEGQQRGSAVADFDRDGRPDLVVTQNSDSTRLYRNERGRPGLRVRLRGREGNPHGIGVQLRWVNSSGRMGPVREVHAGSGFWSQDSPVVVLGGVESRGSIWVRWPGQEGRVHARADDGREVEISEDRVPSGSP
jgi:enediyne biosynthesis protein E4